jgi:hypothetical protein
MASEGRTLVTFDVADFPRIYDEWRFQGRTHADTLVSPQYHRRQIGELIRHLERALQSAAKQDLANRLRYLSEFST